MQAKKIWRLFGVKCYFYAPLKSVASLNETIVIPLSPVSVKSYVDTINNQQYHRLFLCSDWGDT